MFTQNTPKKKILISVGTTQFQELIQFTDSKQFLQVISEVDQQTSLSKNVKQEKLQSNTFQNFQILYQIGNNGKYIPKSSNHYFRLSQKISEIYASADYIISHGGAGTLLQNLHNGKKIIAIANNTLKGNHQLELVEKLAKEKYILGFSNVAQLRSNMLQLKLFLLGKIQLREYQSTKRCIMNELIFDS